RGNDEPQVQQRDRSGEDRLTVNAIAVDPEDCAAIGEREPRHDREQDGRACSQYDDCRSPAPQHPAETKLENAAHRRRKRLALCFTRYLKTAWRLSSGELTSSTPPSSPEAAMSVRRA